MFPAAVKLVTVHSELSCLPRRMPIRMNSPTTDGGGCISENTVKNSIIHTAYSAEIYKHKVHKPEGGGGGGREGRSRDSSTHELHRGGKWGSHAVLKGCIKEVCKVSPWFEALRTIYKNQDSRIGRQACTKIRIGGKRRVGRFAVFFFSFLKLTILIIIFF